MVDGVEVAWSDLESERRRWRDGESWGDVYWFVSVGWNRKGLRITE